MNHAGKALLELQALSVQRGGRDVPALSRKEGASRVYKIGRARLVGMDGRWVRPAVKWTFGARRELTPTAKSTSRNRLGGRRAIGGLLAFHWSRRWIFGSHLWSRRLPLLEALPDLSIEPQHGRL